MGHAMRRSPASTFVRSCAAKIWTPSSCRAGRGTAASGARKRIPCAASRKRPLRANEQGTPLTGSACGSCWAESNSPIYACGCAPRYGRGASRDEFTLTDLLGHERRALAGLLGRRTVAAGSMRIRRSLRTRRSAGPRGNRSHTARGVRVPRRTAVRPPGRSSVLGGAREHAWSAALSLTAEPRLAALLTDATCTALVKRLSGSDPARAKLLLAQAACVLGRLPGHGISRRTATRQQSSRATRTSLDNGRPVATIVLRAWAAETSIDVIEAAELQDAEESIRDRWARLGITVNALALPALCLNLPRLDIDGARICPRASQCTYRCAPCYAAPPPGTWPNATCSSARTPTSSRSPPTA